MKTTTLTTINLTLLLIIAPTISSCKKHIDAQQPHKTAQAAPGHFDQITIRGEKRRSGMYDITLEYGDDDIGWMAYSWVHKPKYVGTHLARSTDHGKTWTYVSTINRSQEGTMKVNGKTMHGVWRYETPTLVYDRGDVPAMRWKLYSQRVFIEAPYKKRSALWGDSWIEYRYARSPEGPWSKPIRAFSAKPGVGLNLNGLSRELNGMVFYNELGSLEYNGTLYMSLDASPTGSGVGEWDKRKIILISSKDHGKQWRYVGALTNAADANHFGYLVFTTSSLARVDNRNYLLVSPAGKKGLFVKNRGHDGTLVFEFDNIDQAKLKRNADGQLTVIKQITPSLTTGGESDYDEQNRNGGIVFCQIDLSVKSPDAEFFKIFNTGKGIGW